MNLVVLFLDIIFLVWITVRLYRAQPMEAKSYFWPALSLKIIAGVAVGALYFFHYRTGDTISYWQDSVKISAFLQSSPAEALSFFWDESTTPDFVFSLQQQAPRSLFFSKICGLFAFATGGNYWMMSALASVISFLGAWFLFRRASELFPSHQRAAAIAFLLFPSVVFWSSGLIKESVGLAALYFLIAICLAMVNGRMPSAAAWVLTFLSLWIGWNLKYYWMGIFLPVAIPTVLTAIVKRTRPSLVRYDLIMWLGLFLVFLLAGTNIHPNFYPSRFLEVIYQSNLEFARLSDPPRIVQYFNLEPSLASLLLNAPAALIAGLFRPFVWESFNLLSIIAGIENLILLVLFVMALPGLARFRSSPHRLSLLAGLVYVILLTSFLALSTPNFGTLSRYKIGAIPVLVFLCLSSNPTIGRWLGEKKSFE